MKIYRIFCLSAQLAKEIIYLDAVEVLYSPVNKNLDTKDQKLFMFKAPPSFFLLLVDIKAPLVP